MDHASKGAAAISASDFSAAVNHYTNAIAVNVQAVDYYIKRSTAYTRISPPDYAAAYKDAEIALLLASKRAKRDNPSFAEALRYSAYNDGEMRSSHSCGPQSSTRKTTPPRSGR